MREKKPRYSVQSWTHGIVKSICLNLCQQQSRTRTSEKVENKKKKEKWIKWMNEWKNGSMKNVNPWQIICHTALSKNHLFLSAIKISLNFLTFMFACNTIAVNLMSFFSLKSIDMYTQFTKPVIWRRNALNGKLKATSRDKGNKKSH